MGVMKQLGLLLKQNLIERKRRWGITLLEIGWPIVLLVIIVVIRNMYPIKDVQECKYEPRAMPSSGLFPFMQSYVCNLDATPSCTNDKDKDAIEQSRQRTNAFTDMENTLLGSGQLFAKLSESIERSAPALAQLSVALSERPEIEEFLNVTGNLMTKDLFKDADALRTKLIKSYGIDEELVDAIFHSTINITQGVELLQDINSELCDRNGTTSFLSKYLVLPADSKISLHTLNKALCQLDKDTKAKLIDLLQEQLDVSAVVSLVKKLMAIFTPDASAVVSDIQRMMEVVGKLSSFQGLAKDLPNIKNALDFAMQMLDFIQNAYKSMPLRPEMIVQLFEIFDPMISQWSDNSQVWQDIKRGISYLNKAVRWVSATLDKLPDMKISLGNLYTDGGRTILDLFNTTITDSEYLIDILGQSTIKLQMMMEWQSRMLSMNFKMNDTVCMAAQSFFDTFSFPANADQTRLDTVINATIKLYCELDPVSFVNELRSKTNFEALLEEFAQYSNSTIGSQPLDWQSIIETGWELVNIITKLQGYFEQYGTLIEKLVSLDFTQLFTAFQKPFNGLASGSMSYDQVQDAVYQSITSSLDFVESMLRNTPIWPYVRQQLIYQNLFTELVVDVFNLSIEAVSITDDYFSHNETELFVVEFLKLDSAAQDAVIKGLTTPKNVRAMLRDPYTFRSQLCTNMTGLLALNLASSTQSQLQNMFCVGATFTMPPGLSVEMMNVGNQIQSKIDKLVEAFTNPSALESSDYDSFATLSAQMKANVDINKMLNKAATDIKLFRSPSLSLAVKNFDWNKYRNVVPYSIMASIMDVLGEAMEDSTGWSAMAPYMVSLDLTIQHVLTVMDKQQALIGDKTTIGKLLDWILNYGHKKLSLTIQAAQDPQKMAKIVELLSSGNPLDVLQLDCNTALQDWFYGVGTLSSLPMTDFQNIVCRPGLANIMYAEILDVYDSTTYVTHIRSVFSGSETLTVDWIEMSKTLTDLPQIMMESSQRYVTHFQQYDWQAWSDFINGTLNTLMSPNSASQLSAMMPNLIGQMEVAFGNSTEWTIAKHVFNIIDVMSVQLADRYSEIAANGLRLSTLFENSTKIKDYIIMQNNISPVIVDIFFDTIIDPTKLTSELFTRNFTGQLFCKDIFVSQFIEFRDQAEAAIMDKLLCEMDWEGLLTELQTDRVSVAIRQVVEPFVMGVVYNNLTDITLDYAAFGNHTTEMIQGIISLQNFKGPIFPSIANGFNMTANNFRYKAALDRFLQQDQSHWPRVLDQVTQQLKNKTTLNNIGLMMNTVWRDMSLQVRLSMFYTKIALQQLRAVSSAARANNGYFSLSDFVLPGELKTMLKALDNAPEMTDTLLYSLIQLMNNPQKLATVQLKPEILDEMCTDLTVFGTFFTLPPDSSITLSAMQTSMCSFRVNVTILVQELVKDIDGMAEMVGIAEFTTAGFPTDLFSQSYNLSADYSMAIQDVVNVNYNNKTVKFTPPRWMDESVWRMFASKIQNYTIPANQGMSQVDGYFAMVYGLAPVIDQSVNSGDVQIRRAFNTANAVLDYLTASFAAYQATGYNDSTFLSGLDELSNVYELYRQIPDFVESIMVTSLSDQTKIQSFATLLTNTYPGQTASEIFCALTQSQYENYFIIPAGNKGDFSHIQQIMCSDSAITGLLDDLRVLTPGNNSYFEEIVQALNKSSISPPFSASAFLDSSRLFYEEITQMIKYYESSGRISDVLQADVWERVVRNIDNELKKMSSQQFNAKQLLGIVQSMDLNKLAPELVPYIHTAIAIANVTLRKLQPLNQTTIDILDFTEGYPETTKAMQLFNLSTDIVELLLMSSSSVKLTALAQLPADQVLPTLCGDDWTEYFLLGANPVVDLDGVKSYLCSVNWTAVYRELITDLEVPYITSQLTSKSPLVWTEVFSTVEAMVELIQDVAALNPSFKQYPWMNETEWRSMLDRASSRLASYSTSFEFQMQSALASLMQVAPSIEQLLNSNGASKRSLYTANLYLKATSDIMQKLSESNWDISAIFTNAPQIKKLLGLLDELPGLVDITLQTSLQPEKMAPLIKRLVLAGNNSDAEFCSIADLQQYVVYDNKTDLSVLQNIICTDMIDFTAIPFELTNLNPEFQKSLNATREDIMNQTVVTDMILTLSEMTTRFTVISAGNFTGVGNAIPHWIQPSAWAQVFNKFADSLANVGTFDMMRMMKLFQMIGMDQILSTVNIPELHVVNAVLDVAIRKLELFNRTEVNLTSILENSPETVRAMDMLPYLADIVEVIIASSRSKEFAALFSIPDSESAIIAICTNSADTYFSVPAGSSIELDKIVTLLCDKNWTAVAQELMSDVNVKEIMAQINNTSPVNFTPTMARVNRMNELVQYLIANPPQFVVDPRWTWLNATVWNGVFMRLNANQQMDLVNMISEYFFGILKPMFGENPEFNKFGVVIERLLDSLKTELSLWNRPGQNVTVADILGSSSPLNDYIVKALSMSPQMYALFLSVSIKNPGDLQLLYSSPNPQSLLCGKDSTWLDYVDIPAQVDVMQVEEFICSANFTVIAAEVMERFNIQDIITALQSNGTANWQKIESDLTEIMSTITSLSEQTPNIIPPFDLNEFSKIAQDIMAGMNWNDAEIYLQMSESMMRYMRAQSFWPEVKPYFQINQLIYTWINDLMSRLNVNPDLSLNLADLFPNATLLHEYVSASLNIDEKTSMKMLAGITVKADKITALFLPTADNSSTLVNLVCDAAMFADFFSVPTDTDVNALSAAICNMISDGGANFADQLKKSLNIDTLIRKINDVLQNKSSEVYSVRSMYSQQLDLTSRIQSFFNATGVVYNNVDLKEKFSRLGNETTLQSYLLTLTENLPPFELKTLGDALNGMMPLLRSMPWWKESEKYFKMMNVLAEVGANRTTDLPTVNVTLKTLIRDADNFRKLLSDSFAFTPDLFESLINAEFIISPTELTNINSTTDLQDLFCAASFPPTVNATAVRIILCDTNFQLILDEFLSEFDFDIVIQEIGMINAYSNVSSDFDWNDLLTNTNNLAQNLGLFFTKLQPPPFQEFFLYDGNVTAWFERLTKALASTTDMDYNFRRMAAALKSLEPSLSAYPEYRQVIIMSQIMQNYLDLAISQMDRFSKEVSLDVILRNKTDLIALVKASFGAAPELLELLLTQPMSTSQLTSMLSDPSADPCTMDLSVLFVNATPADIVTLQNLFCTINITAMFDEIKKEIETTYLMPSWNYDPDAASFDWQAYMNRFTQLSQRISQMIQSPPSISPDLLSLVNVTEYMKTFDRVKQYWLTQQFSLDANSFSSLMQSLNPLLSSSEFGKQLTKFINVADIIISRVNDKLTDIKNNDVSLNTLLGSATELRNYLETVIKLPPETVATLLMSQLGGEALVMLVTDRSSELCSLDADKIFVLPEGGVADINQIKSLFCDANFTVFLEELSAEFDISTIIKTLSSNTSVPIQWDRLFNNSQELSAIITYLASNDPLIDQNLLEAFNMTRFAPVWQSLSEYDPTSLLRLLDVYSPLVREAAGESWPIIQLIIGQYSSGISNTQRVLADLVSSGFTFESLLNNRTAMIELYSKLADTSYDLVEKSYVDLYSGTMTELLKRDEIQAIVCNETTIRSMLPNLPAYVDLTGAFCGVKDDSWVNTLRSRNYSILEAASLISAIDSWYLDEYFSGVYTWDYINSYRDQMLSSASNFTLGDLEKPLRELLSVLNNLGTIPPQFFPGFNASYWMPMIEALSNSYAQKLPEQVLRLLEMLDPLLRDTDFWTDLRTSISAASQYMSWINDKLEEIDRQGQTIQIVKLLPNIEEVRSLLETAMNPTSAAEFLTLTLYPGKLVHLLTSDPTTVLCDAAKFNESFQFRPGVDVKTIQEDLCRASQNSSLVMQKTWELFDMKQLAVELSKLTGDKQPTSQPTESPFRAMLKQMQRFLQNANVITRLIQAFNREMPDIASYINMMLTTVNTVVDPSTNNIGGMCDALVNLVDEVPEYERVRPMLVRIQTINSVTGQIATSLDDLDDFLCEFPSWNMSTFLSKMANSELLGIAGKIASLEDPNYLSTTSFKCSEMIRDAMLPQQKIQNMIMDAANGSFDVCINKLLTENITLLNDVNSYLSIMGGLRDLLNSEFIGSLKWLDPIRPLLEDIISALLGQIQGSRLSSLVNQTAITDLLDTVFNSSTGQVPVSDFLNSFYDVDQLLALLKNTTISGAEKLICDSKLLNSLILDNSVDVDKLTQTLCVNKTALSELLQGIADNLDGDRLELLAATKDIEGFINQLSKHLTALMDQLSSLIDLPQLLSMLKDFDLSAIKELLPMAKKMMSFGSNIDVIVDNMVGILDILETRVVGMTNDTATAVIFDDLRLVLRGLGSLKILRNSLMIDIPMKSILTSTSELEEMLINRAGLSKEEVKDLLNATFTTNVFATGTVFDIQSQLCDPEQIKYLLVLPKSSQLSYEEVSSRLCKLDPEVALNISVNLIKNMQVSEMISNFLTQKFGINTVELREAVKDLAPLQDELSITVTELSEATQDLSLDNLLSDDGTMAGTAGKTGAISTSLLTDVLCGTSISGYGAESEAIGDVDFGEIDVAAIDASGVDDPNYFSGSTNTTTNQCDDIRKTIFKQKGGRIIWTYLKPLFVGKILYTPHNHITRELVSNANSSFDKMAQLFETVKIIVDSQEKLVKSFGSPEHLTRLQPKKMNGQISLAQFKNTDPSLIRLVLRSDLNISALSDQLDLLLSPKNQAWFSALNMVADYADCISSDRFVGVESEDVLAKKAATLHLKGEFVAGLVFTNVDEKAGNRQKRDIGDTDIPKHIEYKIRMDIENVESTMELQELFYSAAPRDNLLNDMRYLRGFVQIQEMVDRAIIKLHGGDNSITQTATLLQQMPAACYNSDVFMGFVYPYIVPIVMTLSWLFAVAHCIKTLTAYRESGLEELMKVMGLKQGVIWTSWFINTLLGMIVLSVIATIFLMLGEILMLSNGVIIFLFLVVFSLSTTMFCYMVGSFFTKANVASAIGVMLFLISYFPYILYTQFRGSYTASYYHVSSLLSTTAFAIGATYISRWEQMGEGVQWSNVNKAPGYNEEDELSVQWMFIWMLIDSLIYFIIGWYARNVLPGKFGYRLPLYFPFTKSYWGIGNSNRATSSKSKYAKSTSDTDLPVGISISKLRKVYKNGKVAIDNLNMDFYEGHVTAFLGRNGAGKTTTINVLTGMTSPTEGSAEINGWNVDSSGINHIRQNLGFCPQFDMLFDFMTVKEHLDLFASLKSSEPHSVIESDVEDMLTNMGLWTVRDELVETLSGGMRRRVSVAMAFIGNSKVIILDEPTSSIDPHGRRVIWDVILKYRTGRTILLCTHHLDEADTLGDKVAILDKGKLRAEGSPMSLKKQHASGYQLFLEKMPTSESTDFDVDRVTDFIKQSCPGATMMTDVGSSLTYTLPSSELPKFDQLFTQLTSNLNSLGISGFGVSDSTLYEVFEKITEGSDNSASDASSPANTKANNSQENFGESTPSSCGSMLAALFRKRFIHTFKDFKSYIALIILPCLFVVLALAVSISIPDRSKQPNLELQTALYPNTYSFYGLGDMTPDVNDLSSTLFTYPGLGTVCMDDIETEDTFSCNDRQTQLTAASIIPDDLPECSCPANSQYTCEGDDPRLDTYLTNTSDKLIHIRESYNIQDYLLATHSQYKTNRYGGWTFETSDDNKTTASVWYDNRAFHSSPSYLNALSNMILRAAMAAKVGGSTSSKYGITVFNHPLVLSQGQLSIKNALEKTADLGISLTFLAAFSLIPAGLCIYLVMEHVKGEKHLQYVSGVGPLRYWLITYFWDMIMFLLPILLIIPLIYAFQIRSLSVGDNILATTLLFISYAWAVLPFMYMTVKAFKNTTTAFFTLLMVNMFLGIALSTLTFLMTFFQFVPNIKAVYQIMQRVFLIFPQYSFTSALMKMSINQARIDIFSQFDDDVAQFYHPFNSKNGIYWNLISLAIQGLVFFTITLLIELKTTNCDDRISQRKRHQDELDEDVVKEKARVLGEAQGRNDTLVVKGLSKQYKLHNFKHILAVKDLTFGVQPGEVFGLCGVNGAGKTSTFKMLTGELLASEGCATLHGNNITSSKSRSKIGYCPQINSLDSLLSGRQVLSVYAQLKGISDTESVISNILNSFGMHSYIDKQVKAMSGGMKRNLCVSVALMGNPDLVFLDEPSAGMDPVARRIVWNQILAAAARGCAIVLTSHSMTECEALCTRMAIMLNGKLACLGSSQHLKNKFGLGYTLKVKVAGPPPHTNKMIAFIRSTWPRAVVKDQHLSTTEFSIPYAGGQTLASLFSLIEQERHNLYIEEYSVFQTTLDQVFIQFARNQQDQIDDSTSSEDTESTNPPYSSKNESFYSSGEDMVMHADEGKTAKALQVLDGEQTWNTHL